jgi:diguanylate cyclase (GGDEF)-like protein/putative nucleotidyltransferase with HDIG domain
MNAYAIAPLVAAIAYIPLVFTTATTRPWRKRHLYFLTFLISAMTWSLVTVCLRGNYFPQHAMALSKTIIILFALTAIQLHLFTSTFFPPQKGRWLPFAYVSLAIVIVLVTMGYILKGVGSTGDRLYYEYSPLVIVITIPLMVIVVRNLYVFFEMLKTADNPVLHNQTLTLIISICVLTVFTLVSLLPWGNEYPVSHYGNLIIAFILGFAVIKHQLVDIKLVIRQTTAWISLGILGAFSFWLLLFVTQKIFDFEMDYIASAIATTIALIVAVFIYKIRGYLFEFMSRAFQGSVYNYRRQLTEFTNKIHNVFSLKEQGGELLTLIIKAVNINRACLLFPEIGGEDFKAQFAESVERESHLTNLRLRADSPIIKYLEKEQKPLSRENLNILPAFLGLWPQEKEDLDSKEIALFVPLISRDHLIAILVLGKKQTGRYTLEDLAIIEDVTNRVAVSLEKEYLSEQLKEREEELSVINNSSAILSSSLDIQKIFGSFIEELKKVVDVNWASIVLTEENNLHCVALSTKEGSAYQVGDRVPLEGTGTGWVVTQKKSFIEPDISREMYFTTGKQFYQIGLRTMAYLPLIAKGKAIGSFIVASKLPNAYSQRHIKLLEQLASQIAMPLENSQLYAKAEKKARIDELTKLYNRRSLDEMIDNEIGRHSRYGGVFTLAILDLDSFKSFNDSYGHLSGDRLLREVGQVIKSAIRNVDYAFRYGGDEFAILLPQTNIEDALQVVERVREKIARGVDSGDIHVTSSIGLASWPDDGISHTDIIAAADVTLYRAKRSGGNRSYCSSTNPSASPLIESDTVRGNGIDTKYFSFINALAESVDSQGGLTSAHSKKVAEYALALGKSLKLPPAEINRLEACALLHDIGKICISDAILNKTDKLTAVETVEMKKHPQIGADIVSRIPQLSSCADVIRHHHEYYDGSGYPDGLKGEAIPLDARIIGIVDAFANMMNDEPRSDGMSLEQALEELKRYSGKRYDPYLVEQFIASYQVGVHSEKRARR